MPKPKIKQKKGRYGPIFYVDKGVIVRQDARGKWLLCIEKGGFRKNKTFGVGRDAMEEALAAAELIATELTDKVFAEPEEKKEAKAPFLKDFSKQWLESNVKRWKPRTYERYEGIFRLHIWPAKVFRHKRISEISRVDIKNFLRDCYRIRSAAHVALVQTILCSIFEEAIEDQLYLQGNPTRNILKTILPPKRNRNDKDPDPFTYEERDLFLTQAAKVCSPGLLLILKLMLFCGLRLGEALAVRLKFFDFNRDSYRVTEGYSRYGLDKPKEDKYRWVNLPGPLVVELKHYIADLKEKSLKAGTGGSIDLLFSDPKKNNRHPYSQRKIQYLVKKICKMAGLTPRNPHDFRHTFATHLLMSGKSPVYVKEQLGHSSIEITVDIYGHWIEGERCEGLEEALKIPEEIPGGKSHIFAYPKNERLITI